MDCVVLKSSGVAYIYGDSAARYAGTSPGVARDSGELPSHRESGHCEPQVAGDIFETERRGHIQADSNGSVRSDRSGRRACA